MKYFIYGIVILFALQILAAAKIAKRRQPNPFRR